MLNPVIKKISHRFIFWMLLLLPGVLNCQVYRFVNIGSSSGIPNGFVYTIAQDEKGFLWAGTGAGIYKFDGFDFYNVPFPDSSINRYTTSSYTEGGGRMWFGCNDGMVYYTENGSLNNVRLNISREISTILKGDDEFIFIVPQGRTIEAVSVNDPSKTISNTIDQSLVVFSAAFSQSGELLLGTQENIKIFNVNNGVITPRGTIEGFDYYGVTAIHPLKGTDYFIVGTNGNGFFLLDYKGEGSTLRRIAEDPDLEYLSVQSITDDSEGNLWIATNESGIIHCRFDQNTRSIVSVRQITRQSGLPGENIRVVFEDREGNYWVGLFGDGLSMLDSFAFSFISPGSNTGGNNIIHVDEINGSIFMGNPEGYWIYDYDNNNVGKFVSLVRTSGISEVLSYQTDSEGNIWIGTKGNGLWVKDRNNNLRLFYRSGDTGEDQVTDIVIGTTSVWLGTLNGVVNLDKKTGRVAGKYNINNGLPHNFINGLLSLGEDNVAVSLKSEKLFTIQKGRNPLASDMVMSGTTMNEITSLSSDNSGAIWVATLGNGLFRIRNDSIVRFTRSDMMLSDYLYSVLASSDGRIWMGHEGGLSRYNPKTGVMRTFSADFANGGLCNRGSMAETSDGKILIGTTEGLIIYDLKKEKKIVSAPVTNLTGIFIDNKAYPDNIPIVLPYKRKYDIRINYVGINFRNPSKVYYETFLDNWDDGWSPPKSERFEEYTLSDGHFIFNLISFAEDGITQDEPLTFGITIKKPFWRTWWFILIASGFISGVVVIIIRERDKNQKKIRQYLENELDARTSVVLQQKAELELQNIEITDSINYAKRIQTSILPDFNKLKETFRDAFIIFRPRDIVSGDFYWYDKFNDDTFILVCADSTGHGVPGAFMSMIGSTLLQDIVTRQRISKPSQILTLLDKQIFSTLNQNIELGVSNDGMDMVVCEINVKNRYIRFASAMRPVIMVLGGEPFYIKGNRSSVGGESAIEKYFDDQEYYLSEGDTLYMFSDGFPDQFGGTDGKKMKIARLKKLIEDVSGLPMNGQREVIEKFYDEWKGDFEQVDDILLIGIKF